MKQPIVFSLLGAVLLGLFVWVLWPPKKSSAPTINTPVVTTNTNTAVVNTNGPDMTGRVTFSTADVPDRDPAFEFTTSIPVSWRVDYVATVKAINLYDPSVTGATLAKAQVFVLTYSAETFQDSSRVTGPVDTTSRIGGQAARQFKFSQVATAVPKGYPTWWSQSHTVAEVQNGPTSPYTFLSFHFAPTVTDAERTIILDAFQFTSSAQPI